MSDSDPITGTVEDYGAAQPALERVSAASQDGASGKWRRERRIRAILETAKHVLATRGHGELTLREVARRAGMSLGNLHYYYPTRDLLLRDLLRFIFEHYNAWLGQISADKSRLPRQRLTATVGYLIEDIKSPLTNFIFFEIWSPAQRDTCAAQLLDRMYAGYCRNFEELIAAISPKMPANKRAQRAALIAFQIEGLMVLLSSAMPRHDYLNDLEEECAQQAQRLASWP